MRRRRNIYKYVIHITYVAHVGAYVTIP